MFLSSSSNKKYENRPVIIWFVSQIEATVGHGHRNCCKRKLIMITIVVVAAIVVESV